MKFDFKDRNFVGLFFRLIAICSVFVTIFMPFALGLVMTVKSSGGNVVTTYSSAYTFIFGGLIKSEHIKYTNKEFIVSGIIALVFVAASLACGLVTVFKRDNKMVYSILTIGMIVSALVAGILFIASHRAASNILANLMVGSHNAAVEKTVYSNTSLGFGFLGPAIFSFFGVVVAIVGFINDGSYKNIIG